MPLLPEDDEEEDEEEEEEGSADVVGLETMTMVCWLFFFIKYWPVVDAPFVAGSVRIFFNCC